MGTRDELRAFNERFSAALAAQDADAVVDCYTEDARLLVRGQPIIRGREALAKLFGAWLAEGPHHMSFESGDVWESGNIVVDVGTTRSPGGTGKYVVLYERQEDGSLRMAVDAAMGDGDAS